MTHYVVSQPQLGEMRSTLGDKMSLAASHNSASWTFPEESVTINRYTGRHLMTSLGKAAWIPLIALAGAATQAEAQAKAATYEIFVSNEKSGDVTVISGGDFSVMATVPVGKRPRGIHASPDGKTATCRRAAAPRQTRDRPTARCRPALRHRQSRKRGENRGGKTKAGGSC